jgi:hypothetical protein
LHLIKPTRDGNFFYEHAVRYNLKITYNYNVN